jgi:DNA-binding protein H-NS
MDELVKIEQEYIENIIENSNSCEDRKKFARNFFNTLYKLNPSDQNKLIEISLEIIRKAEQKMADKKVLIKKLAEFSYKELCEIETSVIALKAKKQKTEAKDLANKLKALITDSGLSSDDVLPILNPKTKTTKSKAKPKYQNPKDPSQTWSGRGKPPVWAKEYKQQGKLSDIEIKDDDNVLDLDKD